MLRVFLSLVGAHLIGLTGTQSLEGQGFLVADGITVTGKTYEGLGAFVKVIQNPSNGDYTGFHIQRITFTSLCFLWLADEGVRTFRVSDGDSIDLQSLRSNNYAELSFGSPHSFTSGSTFMLGFYTGYGPFDSTGYTGIYTSPVFGWARFMNFGGDVRYLEGALESGGAGIIAGTQTIIPVPEPSTLALLAAASALLLSISGERNRRCLGQSHSFELSRKITS